MNRCCLICFLLALIVIGCKPRNEVADESFPPMFIPFDAQRVFADVENLAHFGSRAVGSVGHRHARTYLSARLRANGAKPVEQTFIRSTPRGDITFNNIEVTFPGRSTGMVIISTHYDSRQDGAADFQSANSSASGPAMLLELARIFAAEPDRKGPEIRLLFFDGQEPMVQHTLADGLQGSRYVADQLVRDGLHRNVIAVINLDMVGDRDLTVTLPRNSTPWLRAAVLEAAHRENVRHHFALFAPEIGDDHEPFLKNGMPAITIIDFQYGSAPGRNDYWRTPHDTVDKISAESLDIIGRVTLRLIRDVVSPREGIAL